MNGILEFTFGGETVRATLTEDGWRAEPPDWSDTLDVSHPVKATTAGNPYAAAFYAAVEEYSAKVIRPPDEPKKAKGAIR